MGIAENGAAITSLFYCNDQAPPDIVLEETPLLKEASQQLIDYLQGTRTEFTVPLAPEGTPFQKKVWNALLTIPYGETWSYKKLAETIGNPKACRAVGMANNKN
ncbi:MAG: methylated-DNA--[protein]-cysteine S-methyltransferase, partial [Clostridiales bacterium]|nr:methylated-DNA--[protein]-cysteine S-methyltransferase [Clostridiales bacterium]